MRETSKKDPEGRGWAREGSGMEQPKPGGEERECNTWPYPEVFQNPSRRLAVVKAEHSAQAISTSDSSSLHGREGRCADEAVPQSLMIPFGVIMNEVGLDRSMERGFAE